MGSRCYECGEKFGRCYEHGGMCDCDMHSCGAQEPAQDDSGARVDSGADVDLATLRAAAEVLPDDLFAHTEDCGGSLCAKCGHCLHSIDVCDCDCDNLGGGCGRAIETDEVVFRRNVLSLIARAEAAEAAVGRVRAEVRWLASGPTANRDTFTRAAIASRLDEVLEGTR